MQTSLLDLLKAVSDEDAFAFEREQGLIVFPFLNALCDKQLGDERKGILKHALFVFGKSRLPWIAKKEKYALNAPIPLKTAHALYAEIRDLIPHVIRSAAPHDYVTIELAQALSKQILAANTSAESTAQSDINKLTLTKLNYFAQWVHSTTLDRHAEVSEAMHNFSLYLPDYAKLSKVQGVEVFCFIASKLFAKTPRWASSLMYLLRKAWEAKLFSNLPTHEAQALADNGEMMIQLGLFSMLTTHKYRSNFNDLLDVFKSVTSTLTYHYKVEACLTETMGLHTKLSPAALSYALVYNSSSGIEALFDSFHSILQKESMHHSKVRGFSQKRFDMKG